MCKQCADQRRGILAAPALGHLQHERLGPDLGEHRDVILPATEALFIQHQEGLEVVTVNP